VEALTDELEARAAELIARIDELGGAVAAIEAGWVQQQIEESAFRWQREVEQGERVIVGVNRYVQDEPERIELHRLDPAIERAQRERTQALRAQRDAAEVETAVAEVRRVAETDANLLPALREALAARATVGELCDALRELWGTYDAR
jgi:methylmalonyl-CoA mutase N-terminal domain/subunit